MTYLSYLLTVSHWLLFPGCTVGSEGESRKTHEKTIGIGSGIEDTAVEVVRSYCVLDIF